MFVGTEYTEFDAVGLSEGGGLFGFEVSGREEAGGAKEGGGG